MLYVTTRSNLDAFTANHALCENRAPDGGLYIPYKMPAFSPEDIAAMARASFGSRVAEVLNRLFGSRLTGWDVEFSVGRYPVRLAPLRHRITVGELWHNPQWEFSWMAHKLISQLGTGEATPSDWADLAIRIGVLFGMFGELMKDSSAPIDVAVSGLSDALAARYARDWGLGVGDIILCCTEDASLWSLIHRGQLSTDQPLPAGLERLIFACGGYGETQRYLDAVSRGAVYCPSDRVLSGLRSGFSVSVVGEKRVTRSIPNIYSSGSYLCGPDTALCHCGLQDHRAAAGASRSALILSHRSPGCDAETVAAALGISVNDLKQHFD